MCGIIGILHRNSLEKNTQDIKAALKLLDHRGPDDQGVWGDVSCIQLGHTRLSILDLSHLGHQPMSYQNQRYWITFNGEIYNYVELRHELINLGYHFISKTDTEVILAAYVQWGTSFLQKLRGMFAFAIWDNNTGTLFLARDRTGEKPLYYYYDQETFYFSSELKPICSLLSHKLGFNPIAIDLYLHYQYVPEPLTPLANVHKLPRAHYLLIDRKNWEFSLEEYWNLTKVEPLMGDPIGLIKHELEQVTNLVLRSDVPIGIALSGGIDSGAIAALAASIHKDKLQAFCVGYPNRPPYDERQEAEKLATTLGLPFCDIELNTEDVADFFPDLVSASGDPIADIAAYGQYSVMKLAADKGIKVMLNGLGGDELFWGYQWVADAARLSQSKKMLSLDSQWSLPRIIIETLIKSPIHNIIISPIYERLYSSHRVNKNITSFLKEAKYTLLKYNPNQQVIFDELLPAFNSFLNYRKSIYTDNFKLSICENNSYEAFQSSLQNLSDVPVQICQMLFDNWLVSNCLALSDRLSMASSVEVRSPFLDHKLIELVMGLRKTQPDHELGQKYWLKSALEGILPDEVLTRPKRGFQPPVQEWMSAIINKYIKLVKDGYLIDFKIVNPNYLNSLIKEFSNSRKHSFLLYKMIVLEIWYRQFR